MEERYVIVYKGRVLEKVFEVVDGEWVHFADKDLGFGVVHESESYDCKEYSYEEVEMLIEYSAPKDDYDYAIIELRHYRK